MLATGYASRVDGRSHLEAHVTGAWFVEPHNPPTPPLPRHVPRRPFVLPALGPIAPTIPNRNANPLNIKVGSITRRYLRQGQATISDIPPSDGGRFLKFQSPATGFKAGIELLTSRAYRDLGLDAALRRWSNNGFGAEILAGSHLDRGTRIRQLTRNDFRVLLGAMAAAEGYRSATVYDEIAAALDR